MESEIYAYNVKDLFAYAKYFIKFATSPPFRNGYLTFLYHNLGKKKEPSDAVYTTSRYVAYA